MLVLTRKVGESIVATSDGETYTVTVLKVKRRAMSILVSRAAATHPGEMENLRAQVQIGETLKLADTVDLTLVQVRGGKVRLGIESRSQAIDPSVYRLEAYESTQHKWSTRNDDDDADEELGGSPVPRPSSPNPPPSNVQMTEPREENDGGE